MISRPREPKELSDKWIVGIDLGTSNTNIYKQSSQAEKAEQLEFSLTKFFRTISLIDNDFRKKLLQSSFVPPTDVTLPLPTSLNIFQSSKKNNLLLDYFIYFPHDYKIPDSIQSDIKWEEEDKKTKYFIESLLFLIFLELNNQRIGEVVFLCSHPKAFSLDNSNVFKLEWKNEIGKLTSDPDKRIFNADLADFKIIGPTYGIEGIAAGYFFGSKDQIKQISTLDRAKIEIAAICLDVGGGTTDISLWANGEIVSDESILLAGREIAQLFRSNDLAREMMFSKNAAVALTEKQNETSRFAARLNYILKIEELQIQELLLDHVNRSELKWLRKILTLEFCAISYYTAIMAVATDKYLSKGILERIEEVGICLHWGGNAAKFLNWINFGKYDKEGIASKMLNAVFFQALNDFEVKAKNLDQLQSPGHKSEVSGGLVVWQITNKLKMTKNNDEKMSEFSMDKDEKSIKTTGTICGEDIELEEKSIECLSLISNNELYDNNNQTTFKSTGLKRLKRFLEIFNFFGIRFGLFNEDEKIQLTEKYEENIKDEVKAFFIRAQSQIESKRIIEPVFVIEVRELLNILRIELR